MPASTCLWIAHDRAQEAVDFYVALIDNSRVLSHMHLNNEQQAAGIDVWQLELDGTPVDVMGSDHGETPNTAVSLVLKVPDQRTLDRYWDGMLAAGGQAVQCGWMRDPYGINWQICPELFYAACAEGDQGKAQRIAEQVWQMTKLDVAPLEQAARES